MKCLNCKKEMAIYDASNALHRLTYDVCEACGGLWLDKGELDKMAFQVAGSIEYCSREVAEDKPVSVHDCPRCANLKLFRVRFLGSDKIVIDRCENCSGFWLEGGQLAQLNAELTRIMPVESKGFSQFLTGTHLPHFARRTRRAAETVKAKPVLPISHAKPLGKTEHTCPSCQKALESYSAYGIKLETCPECHGLWLHKGELKALRDKLDALSDRNLRWMNDEIAAIGKTSAVKSNRHCPACHDNLLVTAYFGESEVMIDWCARCSGIWLDHDEFETIAEFERNEYHEMSSADMKKKAAEEIKKIWTDSSESKIEALLDAKAAIAALANTAIYEHPALTKVLAGAMTTTRIAGG